MQLPVPNIWEIHPTLVHFPICLLLAAVVLEFVALRRPALTRVAAGLLIAGVVFGWLTAGAGLLAMYTVPAHTEQAHTFMEWHMWLALGMLVVFTGLAVARGLRRDRPAHPASLTLGVLAALVLVAVGYLGGVIVYHGGAGVEPGLLAEEVRHSHDHGGGHAEKSSGHEHSHEHQ